MATYDIEHPNPPPQKTYTTGLTVPVWNRPNYLRRFLRGLRTSVLPDTLIVFVDDCSTDERTLELLRTFEHPHATILRCRAHWREYFQFHKHLRFAWDLLSDVYSCRYLTNLDPDMVMRSNWLQRLHALYQREAAKRTPLIVSGFNKYSGIVLERGSDYNVQRFLGGANMFFDAATYRQIIRSQMLAYWDDHVVEAVYNHGGACLTTRPSCLQHVGRQGLFSSLHKYDKAMDYSIWGRLSPYAYAVLAKRRLVGVKRVYEKACAGNASIMNARRRRGGS